MQNWNEIRELLSSKKEIVILSHRSPDGDSIGSSLGMAAILDSLNHAVNVITPDPAPQFLSWMAGFDSIINFERSKVDVIEKVHLAKVIVCLDFNTLSRIGQEFQKEVESNKDAYIVNIDHHENPDDFADFQLSDTSASSTAQMVYDFIIKLGYADLITKELGECLYTGILTDTGSFRFPSTTAETHRIVAQLMDVGVKPPEIQEKVYNNFSIDRLKLLGFALNERFNIYHQYKTGIIYLSETDLTKFKFQKGDTEGLVNYPLSVASIIMSILITEKDGKVKMSFRSKGKFHVNELAGKYFSGGGHLNAAGGISDLSVLETVKKIEALLPEYESQLRE